MAFNSSNWLSMLLIFPVYKCFSVNEFSVNLSLHRIKGMKKQSREKRKVHLKHLNAVYKHKSIVRLKKGISESLFLALENTPSYTCFLWRYVHLLNMHSQVFNRFLCSHYYRWRGKKPTHTKTRDWFSHLALRRLIKVRIAESQHPQLRWDLRKNKLPTQIFNQKQIQS